MQIHTINKIMINNNKLTMKKYCIEQYRFFANPTQTIRQNILNFFYDQPHIYIFKDRIKNRAFHNLDPGITLLTSTKKNLGKGIKLCVQ